MLQIHLQRSVGEGFFVKSEMALLNYTRTLALRYSDNFVDMRVFHVIKDMSLIRYIPTHTGTT